MNGFCVNNPRAYIVIRIGIDAFQDGKSITDQFGLDLCGIHRIYCFVDFLRFLPGNRQIFPACEKRVPVHLSGLHKLVNGNGDF